MRCYYISHCYKRILLFFHVTLDPLFIINFRRFYCKKKKKKEISSGSSISMDTDDVVDILSIFIGIGVLFPLLRRHYDAPILRRMPKPLGWWCHSINIYSVGSGFVFVLFFLLTISNLVTFSLLVQALSMQKKRKRKKKDFYGTNENGRQCQVLFCKFGRIVNKPSLPYTIILNYTKCIRVKNSKMTSLSTA